MKCHVLYLLFPLLLLLAGATLASAAVPEIQEVYICPGRDTDAPDWTQYHQAVYVRASDADGAADIVSVTITDPDGAPHTVTPSEGGWWSQADDYTIQCGWCNWWLLESPTPGLYEVVVADADTIQDILTAEDVPPVWETPTVLDAPVMESVIYDTQPTFQWTPGVPGAYHFFNIRQEDDPGFLWRTDVGTDTEVDYDTSLPPLQPGYTHHWRIDSWSRVDSWSGDPRVTVANLQCSAGRFTVYEEWPILPDLPGKMCYQVCGWWWDIWGHDFFGQTSIMHYNTDPATRIWLAPDYAEFGDWSPDGSKLLFAKPYGGHLWIDYLDGSPPVEVPGIGGGDCRWAPDGVRLVYVVHGPPSPYVWPNFDIWAVNSDGTNPYPLVDSIEYEERWPVWSPDGLWIVYRKAPASEGSRIWLIRYDGTEDHPLIATGVVGYEDHGSPAMDEPSWHPNGQRLAVSFTALKPGGDPANWPEDYICGIATVSRDGGDGRMLEPVFVAPPGVICCAQPHLPQWSPDGNKIVFSSGHHLPPEELPAWGEFCPGVELWMRNANGTGDPVRLTYDHSFDYYVSWWAPNTEPGEDVSVKKGDTTVIFEGVTDSGTTTITIYEDPPPETPQGFQFQGEYYDIYTDATLAPDSKITIKIDYDDTGLTEEQEQWLCLLHWETDQWVDITVRPINTAENIITGECYSLSPFGIALGPQFQGLLPPISNDGSSVFKLKSTIPVKFQLVATDGSFVTDADARLYLTKLSSEVTGTVYQEAEATGNANTGNAFRYDAEADQYIFNLGTKSLSTGTWILQVTVNGLLAKQVQISLK